MRTLVIPDIHHHTEAADQWIRQFPADQIVFLGDYFDSFGDDVSMARSTAEWLHASLRCPNRIHLWGNHDLAYAFPENRHLRCSGFTDEKAAVIRKVLSTTDWKRLRLFHAHGELLFSHAGLDPAIFTHPVLGVTIPRLTSLCDDAMACAKAGLPHPVLGLRGLTWLRWWDMNILEDFHQVVGHTPDPQLRIDRSSGRFNVCLDTFGHYVGMLEDSAFYYLDTRNGTAHAVI